MKNLLLIAFAIMPMLSKGQITLEHTYGAINFAQPVLFSSNGEKIMTYDTAQVYLYNMDHTLWKTISPSITTGYKIAYVYGVSDNLFNSDNLVEAVIGYVSLSTFPRYKSDVVSEAGTVITSLDTSYSGSIHYNSGANSYKLFTNLLTYSSASPYTTNVYSLPGTLPCGKCGGLGTESVDHAPAGTGMNAFPNPSAGMTVITYDLPNGVSNGLITLYNSNGQVSRVYSVNSNSRELIINSNELAPGMYSYSLSGDGIAPVTKKMIIAN